jgi:hypothetical protein
VFAPAYCEEDKVVLTLQHCIVIYGWGVAIEWDETSASHRARPSRPTRGRRSQVSTQALGRCLRQKSAEGNACKEGVKSGDAKLNEKLNLN